MPITFENDNDVIVYALETIISYARDNQYVFLAQSIWWISSILGLQQGLIVHIDNLRIQSEVPSVKVSRGVLRSQGNISTSEYESLRKVTVMPRHVQEESRFPNKSRCVHSDRISQIQNTTHDISNLEDTESESERLPRIVESTNQFIQKSHKERKAFNKQKHIDSLSRTRSE